MSGSALVRDPNNEHRPVAMFNSLIGLGHIAFGRVGFAELLK